MVVRQRLVIGDGLWNIYAVTTLTDWHQSPIAAVNNWRLQLVKAAVQLLRSLP
jgi:hypothetical protein